MRLAAWFYFECCNLYVQEQWLDSLHSTLWSRKPPYYILNNWVKETSFNHFSVRNSEKISNQKVTNLSTLPVKCSCCTLRIQNSFLPIISLGYVQVLTLKSMKLVFFTDEKLFTVAVLRIYNIDRVYTCQWQPNSTTSVPAVFCAHPTSKFLRSLLWYWNSLIPTSLSSLITEKCCQCSDLQNCWRRLSSIETRNKHIMLLTQLSICAMRHSIH